MINVIPFAPELQFRQTIGDTSFYQFPFLCQSSLTIAPNIVLRDKRQYVLTVAAKGDTFTINIRDTAGLDYSSDTMSRAEFEPKWKTLIQKLESL